MSLAYSDGEFDIHITPSSDVADSRMTQAWEATRQDSEERYRASLELRDNPQSEVNRLPLVDEITWKLEGNCVGLQRIFFPRPYEMAADRDKREAIAAAICRTCPVLDTCLDYAITNNEAGFWAGTTGEDRVKMKKRREIRR